MFSDRRDHGDISILSKNSILLTGATGYVGGRLLQRLLLRGDKVRCLSRRPDSLRDRFGDSIETAQGDVLDSDSLRSALQGITTAYYLVHALAKKEGFFAEELNGARNFAFAAREAGVQRIIYLGGLGHGDSLSPHLASRQEVGRVLADSGIEIVELRAGIILGAGSLSYEMIRALVRKLPIMVTPLWARVRTQPIAVKDVLSYLEASLDLEFDAPEHRVYEIGAPETVSYQGLMTEYARQRGLKRFILPVPVLSPKLSSLWLGLVTPVYAQVGRKLLEGVKNETVVKSDRAREDFTIQPLTIREALQQAWEEEERQVFETRWSDAVSSLDKPKPGGVSYGNRLIDTRTVHVDAPPEKAFLPVQRIGGQEGYHAADFLWRIRGLLDLLVGGAGMRRGRRDPDHVSVGDTIDFWRVEAVEPNHLLRLQAEMRLPGRAWLQFEVTPDPNGGSIIRQTAIFDPLGLSGLLYWYSIWPIHAYVFRAMLAGIANRV